MKSIQSGLDNRHMTENSIQETYLIKDEEQMSCQIQIQLKLKFHPSVITGRK
jgi:hypothetical protein